MNTWLLFRTRLLNRLFPAVSRTFPTFTLLGVEMMVGRPGLASMIDCAQAIGEAEAPGIAVGGAAAFHSSAMCSMSPIGVANLWAVLIPRSSNPSDQLLPA